MKRKKNERSNISNGTVLFRNDDSHKRQIRVDHKVTRQSAIVPYTTKSGIKIGIYYEPKVNYYNPDQDWVQKAILGIETSWTTDIVVFCAMYSVLLYAVLGLITRGYYE